MGKILGLRMSNRLRHWNPTQALLHRVDAGLDHFLFHICVGRFREAVPMLTCDWKQRVAKQRAMVKCEQV